MRPALTDVLRARAHESARDAAIRAFLKSRPEFLRDDPDLLGDLGLRVDAANLVDFGPAALARVTQAHRKESGVRRRLEAVARANFLAQAQTHAAVIEILDSADHADLADRLDLLARTRFGLSAAVIALEGSPLPEGWRGLAEGQVDLVLGQGRAARLGVVPTALGLFGALAPGVGSLALIRLTLSAGERAGILAFASADETAFSPAMGHELIDFLARVTERTAERWPLG
ncbi:MAG: DUF484 family protein [Caulobacteraceae bacterium]|nr:DUF484 family protein [Caulobacteraceae bacterium]